MNNDTTGGSVTPDPKGQPMGPTVGGSDPAMPEPETPGGPAPMGEPESGDAPLGEPAGDAPVGVPGAEMPPADAPAEEHQGESGGTGGVV
jgi:hypothetical protein